MIPELTLSGPPRERGRAHGEQLRSLIAETLGRFFDSLPPGIDPPSLIERLMHQSGFLDPVEAHTPALLEEVRGIAEGAGQPVEAMFAWQLIDECWWYVDELMGQSQPHEACSAMAVNDGTRGLVAQTQDLPRHFDGSQVMLRYLDVEGNQGGMDILAPSAAGLLAYNGVNSEGLAVCITTLSQLGHQRAGVASGFVVPSLLRCRSVDEAVDWLRRTPRASGNSFVIGTRDRSVAAEVSADGVTVVDDGSRALHTNHALAQPPVREYLRFESSVERLAQLDATVDPAMTLDGVAAMYAQGPVCQPRAGAGDVLSVATMIFELDDTQRCHLAPGPLDTHELTTYEMTR